MKEYVSTKARYNITLPEGIAPALSRKSYISMVKFVHAGKTRRYGGTYVEDSDRMIATVITGYAEMLNHHLSNDDFVLINVHKAPIVCGICMNQTMVDFSHIHDVKMGDKVVILGKSGGLEYGIRFGYNKMQDVV